MSRCAGVVALIWLLSQTAFGADRLAEVKALIDEHEIGDKGLFRSSVVADATIAEHIARYEALPCWRFLPRFVALAEAQPDDEAAFLCCDWIIQAGGVGNGERQMFPANCRKPGERVKYHTHGEGLPMLCFRAVSDDGLQQEQFLRDVLARKDLSRAEAGFATLALAELLALRVERCGQPPIQSHDELQEYLATAEEIQTGARI